MTDRKIAARIDAAVLDFERQGLFGGQLVEAMISHLPDLQGLWDRVSERELHDLCLSYPGFYRFAALMEDFSAQDQAMRSSGTHPYQHLDALKEPFRSEVNRLLLLANDLAAVSGEGKKHPLLIDLWREDVKRLLSGDFAGPMDKGAVEILTATFGAIEARL
ncbi:hypothetical protein [uncultured Roseibium sp.]|uniref:hypothetical protein n=1 Tax=uncultured Roseibium sp. TaxID=1936171 RepID=UPI002622475B|nr:hypothetical protein [uncultured Roseibium sp.]